MKATSILAIMALLNKAEAAHHPHHEMAYHIMHPNKAPMSHAEATYTEGPSQEQQIESAKLGQVDFIQVHDDEFAEGDDDSNMSEAERNLKFKEEMKSLEADAVKTKAAAKAKSLKKKEAAAAAEAAAA